jgi:hypothetical protein
MGSGSGFSIDFLYEVWRKVTGISGARNHHLCITHPPGDELGIDEFHKDS